MKTMEKRDKTRSLLIKHYRSYPKLKIQDLFKFLYQSAFGCEHLVTSHEMVADYISKEYSGISSKGEAVIEELDGDYFRVPLACMQEGLTAKTLGWLFFASAKKETDGEKALLQKLETAKELIKEGALPFSLEEFEKAVIDWENEGYGAVRHSDAFREEYKPSYRVIAKEYVPFLPLFTAIDKLLAKGSRVRLAVEGGSASGKTTLGNLLSDVYHCTVFHMDDFFLRPEQRTPERYAEAGGNIDRERFIDEVLQPLHEDKTIYYRRFDCSTMSVGEGVKVTPERLVVIEGAYSMHPQFEKYYDLSVFLNISSTLQRERILKRNSPESSNRFFEEWIPLEHKYFSEMNVLDRCDMHISIIG